MEQVTSKSTNRDLLFFLLCTFTSFVLLLGLKYMLNLHLNAGPVCGGFSGIPSNSAGAVKESYQVKFHVSTISTQPPWAGKPSSLCNHAWYVVVTVLVELEHIPHRSRRLAVT